MNQEEDRTHEVMNHFMNMDIKRLEKEIANVQRKLDIEDDKVIERYEFPHPKSGQIKEFIKMPWMYPHWKRGLNIAKAVYEARKDDN